LALTRTYTYRQALKKARKLGVREADTKRGKGSHRIWQRADDPSRFAPVPCHGEGREIAKGTLRAVLRRLGIDEDEFDRA